MSAGRAGARAGVLPRYVAVGAVNTVTALALFAAIVAAGTPYLVALVAAYAAGILVGYTLNRRWTFAAGPHRTEALVRYVVVQTAGLAVNALLLAALVEAAGLPVLLAQCIALAAVLTLTFQLNSRWSFAHAP